LIDYSVEDSKRILVHVRTNQSCICITGPTACGKTELALQLAEEFPIEIISMDSAMVYRGMNIGTAKPPQKLRKHITHHLIDIVEPTDTYSAGRFVADAKACLCSIRQRNRIPLIVGGTLLYLRALRDGLAELPGRNLEVRKRLDQEAEAVGWSELHNRLLSIDPDSAVRIAPTDRQRIQRALEVHEITGKTLTSLYQKEASQLKTPINALALVPEDRGELSNRIEQRFDDMVAEGFTEEVESLRARGDLSPTTTAMRAVGYRQIWSYLDGKYDWRETRTKAIVATRQLAKRQMTWLRADSKIKKLPMQFDSAIRTIRKELIDPLN
jgi:tRNA dimethylallyltransferase